MRANLRISLTILSLGFAIDAVGATYALVTRAAQLPAAGLLLYLNPAFTVAGLLFLFIGRHEWNELHRRRVTHVHLVFFLAIGTAAIGAAFLAYLVYVVPASAAPAVAAPVVAVVAGVALWATYVTYLLVIFHLVGPPGRVVAAAALVWAAIVAFLVAGTVESSFPRYLVLLRSRTESPSSLISPLTADLSLLAVTYLLLFAVFLDAHRRVVRGLDPPSSNSPEGPAVAPRRGRPGT